MPYSSTVAVALTGASGLRYGLRLIEYLLAHKIRVWVLYSRAAQIVAQQEGAGMLCGDPQKTLAQFQTRYAPANEQLQVFGQEQWFAPPASGTGAPDAMVVCPCTMGTLASIASGLSQNLIERAADVMIKENRKLILVPRETPFSAIHLENMLRLARLGVCILPPNPGFYQQPQTIDDLIDFVVARILDQLAIPHTLLPRWGEA